MKKNTMRNRKISLLSILLLVLGTVLPLPGSPGLVVKAAGQEPSVYNFASRKQLMDGSLNMSSPDAEKNGTAGYLCFGKEESGGARRWYVIGKDKGNSKDNVILFSCSDMGNKYFWDSGVTNPNPNDGSISEIREFPNGVEAEGVEYEDSSDPKKVYVNHYGVSDLRKEFGRLEKDTRYFTAAEQKLMLSTVVSNMTADERDNIKNYTVTDKLYAPAADAAEGCLLFGSGAKKEDMVEAYPKGVSASFAWTRTPVIYSNGVHMKNEVYTWKSIDTELDPTNVYYYLEGYHPAFALDLTDVLFTSSAPASKGGTDKLDFHDAMYIRMRDDGSRLKGTSLEYSPNVVTYSGKANSYLVIQGRNEKGENWYYAAQANTGRMNYSLDWKTLKTYVNSVDIGTEGSFDKCRIWIETTDTDGFTYAFTGKSVSEEPKEIGNVILTDIEVPDPEKQAFDKTAKCETEGVLPAAPAVSWFQKGTEVAKPEYDQTYTASITLEADKGYKFADKVTATVNGHVATAVLDADTGILTVTYDFDTGPDKPKIEFDVNAFSGKYDGKPHTVTAIPKDPADAEVYYGVADEDGKVTYSKQAPQYVNAGKYTVYIRIEKNGYTPVEDYTVTITISKRRIRIKVEDQKIVWDKPLPIAGDKYKAEGELLEGDVITEVVLTAGPAGLKIGKTGWITVYNGDVKIENGAGEDVSANYIIEGVPGELTVVHNSALPPEEITAEKEKTEYKAGDKLDIDDLDITARYEDGYSEKVTDYTTNADSIDMSRPGEKKLIITYEGKEFEILIYVTENTSKDNNSNDNDSNPNDSSGNGSSGSGTGSGGGASNSGGAGVTGSSATAQTGDTAPLSKWSFTAVCSEMVILCVLLFYLNKGGKRKKR